MGVEGEREWSKRAGREHERGGKESDGSLSRIRRRRRRCSSFFLFAREICSLFLLFQTYHRVVRVRRRHRCGGLRGQLIELGRGDALVDARGDLLGDEDLFFFLKRERESFVDGRLPRRRGGGRRVSGLFESGMGHLARSYFLFLPAQAEQSIVLVSLGVFGSCFRDTIEEENETERGEEEKKPSSSSKALQFRKKRRRKRSLSLSLSLPLTGSQNSGDRPYASLVMRAVILSKWTASLRPSRFWTCMVSWRGESEGGRERKSVLLAREKKERKCD